ncbi:hypothetical protein Poli38472_007991 [Pythium oligandrum]|uniref:Uncharacterized protein n=1 Tax=Pythium oligandrum TaxID=41045 RepID=A0A8K1CKS6_PYTOL|nr:hypothetical protein Poli38472_007991 [Pythium oligandrum]|eukprot:TMW65349.1 hypothetical protein Poli38472_007991 [Pythium oligandrum]
MASDDGLGRAIARDLDDHWRYDDTEDEEQMVGYAEDDGMTKLTQWVMRYQREIEQLPHQVVEALGEAMELTRHEMDEQSAQVLAVLHDKDERIRELEALLVEKEAENTKSTRTIAVQAEDIAQGKPDMVDQSVQCDDQVGQAQLQAMAIRLEEQHEQIQVLSDDVDRYRLEAASLRSLHERAVAITTAQATQTDEEVATSSPDQALRVMAALRGQLERVEAHNRELQALLERLEIEKNATQGSSEDDFVAIECELTKAVHSMTDSTSCAVMELFTDPLPPDMSKTNTTRAIQAELDASLGRIAELTALSDQLQAKLRFSKKLHRQQAKDKEQLQVQLDASTSTNASLAEQLARCQQELLERNGKAPTSIPSSQESSMPLGKPGTTADVLQLQLSAREQENLELVRQLCEMKAKCYETENTRVQLESKCREMELNAQQQRQQIEKSQVSHLESYMEKINTTLAKIEQEKIKLSEENESLKRQVQSLTQELTAKQIVTSSMRSCGTETEATRELEHLRALPEYQEMETRLVLLKNQLDGAQQRYEGLQRTIETERTRRSEEEKKQFQSVQDEKAKYEALMDELRDAFDAVQNEFTEYQAASTEAHEESEKRIVYLTRCVEECSRLVDSDGSFSTRDIYDTIVNLSKNLVNLRPTPALATKKKAKAAGPAMASSGLGASKRDKRDLLAMDEVLKDRLQVETWRLRAAKLEEALRAAKLQNKTFEDIVNQLEDQMEGVKVEIKDRMTKEAALLNKQNNAKMEAANAKVQCATLTSRLAEACGELKRSQESVTTTEKELVRVRAALQRKTELLSSQKQKNEVLERELEKRTQRLLQLEGVEKSLLGMQQKQKDQVLAMQELRQQCNAYQEMHLELTRQVESEKNQVTSLQTRIKGLRQENGLLREQVKSQTKRVVEAAVEKAAKASHSQQTRPGDTEAALEQTKALKRRVLQKQEVIIAQKTKIASLEAQVTTQQTRLLALTQSQRVLQETQRLTQQSMLQGVEDIKTELEASVATRVEELDGLRASLYDACEVFVHCRTSAPSKKANKADTKKRDPWSSTSDSSATASMRSYMHPEEDEDPSQSRVRTEILSELRHYAHLSAHDLEDLNIVDGTRREDPTEDRNHGRRIQEELWTRKQAQRVLEELEHALEVTPQDCRTEICQVLEFLCGPETKVSSVKHARRY